ncbi:hypothetical protein Pelo_5028 [Pelomyxa schiedti]|nr:hypothetical protein Pelo_5028 [Pelomyxa schiedti]
MAHRLSLAYSNAIDRNLPVIQKVRAWTRAMRHSNIKMNILRKHCKALHLPTTLIMDTRVRWISTGLMITRAVQLQTPLTMCSVDPAFSDLTTPTADKTISSSEWEILKLIASFTEPVNQALKRIQSYDASLATGFLAVWVLQQKIQAMFLDTQNETVTAMKRKLEAELNQRFALGNAPEHDLIRYAVLLDPRWRNHWIWTDEDRSALLTKLENKVQARIQQQPQSQQQQQQPDFIFKDHQDPFYDSLPTTIPNQNARGQVLCWLWSTFGSTFPDNPTNQTRELSVQTFLHGKEISDFIPPQKLKKAIIQVLEHVGMSPHALQKFWTC